MGETFATSRAGGRGRGGERFGFDVNVNFPIPLPSPPSQLPPSLGRSAHLLPLLHSMQTCPVAAISLPSPRRAPPPSASSVVPTAAAVVAGRDADLRVAFRRRLLCRTSRSRLCNRQFSLWVPLRIEYWKEIFWKSKKVCWFGSVIVVEKNWFGFGYCCSSSLLPL